MEPVKNVQADTNRGILESLGQRINDLQKNYAELQKLAQGQEHMCDSELLHSIHEKLKHNVKVLSDYCKQLYKNITSCCNFNKQPVSHFLFKNESNDKRYTIPAALQEFVTSVKHKFGKNK